MSRYLRALAFPALLLSVSLLGGPAVAREGCVVVNGSGSVVFVPTVGGFVGPVDLDGDGDPDATSTAIVVSLEPSDDGTLHAVTTHSIVITGGTTITTLDRAVLSPTDTGGLYRLNSVLTIMTGGSGTLVLHGDIHLVEGWAIADVHGKICD
jgi:hypothetical protein